MCFKKSDGNVFCILFSHSFAVAPFFGIVGRLEVLVVISSRVIWIVGIDRATGQLSKHFSQGQKLFPSVSMAGVGARLSTILFL
jgi:hypothetical protein